MARKQKPTTDEGGRRIFETDGVEDEEFDPGLADAMRGAPGEQRQRHRNPMAGLPCPVDCPAGSKLYELTGTAISKQGNHYGLKDVVALTDEESAEIQHYLTPVEWDAEEGCFVTVREQMSAQRRSYVPPVVRR